MYLCKSWIKCLFDPDRLILLLCSFQADDTVAFGYYGGPAYGVNWQYQPDNSDVKLAEE